MGKSKSYSGSVNLSINDEIYHALTAESVKSGQPMTTIVEEALRVELAHRESERRLIHRLRELKGRKHGKV